MNEYPLMLTVNDAAIAVAMGVFQVGVGLAIYTIGSKVVPAVQLTLLSMTEVILGPFWVWLFLGETFGVYTLIGGVILMLAIWYLFSQIKKLTGESFENFLVGVEKEA